jgi:pimeloyl-ACP methyl ester carboxylesterase
MRRRVSREELTREATEGLAPVLMELPDTQYARTREGEVAYQVYGDGPVDLVAVGGPAAHLEVAWENAEAARYLERLGSFARAVRFDRRGTGLSDPLSTPPALEDQADDLDVVMDAVGLERAALLGEGDAGRLCALFAATRPDRVTKLVLYGTSPSGRDVLTPRLRQALLTIIDEHWGEGALLPLWAPSRAEDPSFVGWWRRFEQAATSRETARALIDMTARADVRHLLGRIRAPTLVLHRTGDTLVPVELARELAREIPQARLMELPGVDNLCFGGDTGDLLDEIERFLTADGSR